ncbi:filamentous hemagglutinin N-terminal domain-containing protein, partial [Pasteurellaceae bacterium LIM206]|nr:filamentous hemagglutinin N-terminal domain-containing protein [Pasteurellaceae bacterium LIM206]
MNKKCFRVIFSRTLGRLVVTSELAKTIDKAKSEPVFPCTPASAVRYSVVLPGNTLLRPLTFGLFCALGMVSFPHSAWADGLVIQADQNAPANQQPIVLQTANGLPQVNIQTPNDKGLSHNKYQQFNVDSQGAILNNSHQSVQTQQAGLVQGNPYLAGGEAKVILNEVTSANPSLMKGYLEVAGQKAEVIIANPNGLTCDGCGMINAVRSTLTTGKPELQDGQIDHYQVTGGKLTVTGRGLDNSRVDYTDLIARQTEINAGVWSNKKINVVAGKNRVKQHSAADEALQITRLDDAADGNQPTVAIDVKALGGMYAGKIHLVGTEQGVGVRNAGHIGAGSDSLTIDVSGRLVNTGTLNAHRQIDINAAQDITNQGRIESERHHVRLDSQGALNQSGQVLARGGDIEIDAKQTIEQHGESVAKGNITYRAKSIKATDESLLAAGITTTADKDGDKRRLDARLATGSAISINATDSAELHGRHVSSGNTTITANTVDADRSRYNAHSLQITATVGNVSLNRAEASAVSKIAVSTPKTLSARDSRLAAERLEVQQQTLNTQNALWRQRGNATFTLKADQIENQNGTIVTGGDFKLTTQALNSTNGTLAAGGSLGVHAADITNQGGRLQAGSDLDLITQHQLNNQQGKIAALNQLVINAAGVDNRQGVVYAEQGDITVQAADRSVDNRQGFLAAGRHMQIRARDIQNNKTAATGSLIQAGGKLTLDVAQLNNQGTKQAEQFNQGIVARDVALNGAEIDNWQGGIYVSNNADLNVTTRLDNTQGEILGWNNVHLQGASGGLTVTNSDGSLQAGNQLRVQTDSLSGDGLLAGKHIDIGLKTDFDIQRDIQANGTLSIASEGRLINHNRLSAGDKLILNATDITNHQPAVISAAETRVTAQGKLTNEGLINSFNDRDNAKTVIKADTLTNAGSGRIYGDNVALQADTIRNTDSATGSAVIAARQRLDLAGKTIENDTALYEQDKKTGATLFSGGDIVFGRQLDGNDEAVGQAESFKNKSSIVEALGSIKLNVADTRNTNEHFSTVMQEYPEEGSKTYQEYMLFNARDIQTGVKIKMDRLKRVKPNSRKVHDTYDLDWNKELSRRLEADELQAGYIPESNQQACMQADPSICYVKPSTVYDGNYAIWARFNIEAPQDSPVLGELPQLGTEPEKPKALSWIKRRNPKYVAQYEADMAAYEQALAAYKQQITAYNEAIKPYLNWVNNHQSSFEALNQQIKAQNDTLGGHYNGYWRFEALETKVIKETVKTSLPGQILAGGDIVIGANQLTNDKSSVIAGGSLQIEADRLQNLDHKGLYEEHLLGNSQYMLHKWRGRLRGRRWYNSDLFRNQDRVESHSFDMNVYQTLSGTAHNQISKTEVINNKVTSAALKSFEADATNGRPDEVEVRTVEVDTRLPSQSLYKVNPMADSHVLIETDPNFTDRRKWLSSDYMYNALRSEHDRVQKRLGDGYYEQRLVREQINRLTGRNFIGGYTDYDSQYKALMDAGISFAQKFNLRMGVALTAAQVAALTSDIVWLETQTVLLADGHKVEVLVPKVYAVVKQGDIDGSGTLLAGKSVKAVSNEMVNQGTIAGREFVSFNTAGLNNSGTIIGAAVAGTVAGDMENLGGSVIADSALLLNVMGNLTHQSTTRTAQSRTNDFAYSHTGLDRKALLHVKGENGTLQVMAENLTVNGADILNDGRGTTYLKANHNLTLGTVATGFDEKMGDGNDYRNERADDVVVSHVKSAGDTLIRAANIYSEGARIEAEQALALRAENDLVLGTATKNTAYEDYHQRKSGSIARTTKQSYSEGNAEREQGSSVSGRTITLAAGNDFSAKAADIVADEALLIHADNNVTVSAGTNHNRDIHWEKKKTSGVFSGGGLGVTFGTKSELHRHEEEGWTQSDARSAVGSLTGNVTIQAGGHAQVTGTDVIAPDEKTVTISGNSLQVEAGKDVIETSERHEYKQSGLTLALSTPVTDSLL